MKSSEELKSEAVRCRRLAAGLGNNDLAAKLIVLAEELEADAAVREQAEGQYGSGPSLPLA